MDYADDSDAYDKYWDSGKVLAKSKVDWKNNTEDRPWEDIYAVDGDYDSLLIYDRQYGQILNYHGTKLPKTGGSGIALFALGGAALIGIGVFILISKKKKAQSKL